MASLSKKMFQLKRDHPPDDKRPNSHTLYELILNDGFVEMQTYFIGIF